MLLGPPGAGKGTQAQRLATTLGAAHLSSGEVLRQAVAEGTDLGKQVAALLDGGQLVPTELLAPLLEERVAGLPAEQPILFDGFPRSEPQARLLDEMLARQGRRVNAVLCLDVPHAHLHERLLARRRGDDLPEVIAERLNVYERETAPLLEWYRARDLLRVVDGTGTPDAVAERVHEATQTDL